VEDVLFASGLASTASGCLKAYRLGNRAIMQPLCVSFLIHSSVVKAQDMARCDVSTSLHIFVHIASYHIWGVFI
jgi:hypothetical protein